MISDTWVAPDPDPGDLITEACYHHNAGYTGEVWINVATAAIDITPMTNGVISTVRLPMALVKHIAAEWVRSELEDRLAEAEGETLLLGATWQGGPHE